MFFFFAVWSFLLLGRLKTSQADRYVSELPSPAQTAKKQTRPRPNSKKKKAGPNSKKKQHVPRPNSKTQNTPPAQTVNKNNRPKQQKQSHDHPPKQQKQQHAWKGRRVFFVLLFARGRFIFFAVCAGPAPPPKQQKKSHRPDSKNNNTRKAQTTKKTRQQQKKHSYLSCRDYVGVIFPYSLLRTSKSRKNDSLEEWPWALHLLEELPRPAR